MSDFIQQQAPQPQPVGKVRKDYSLLSLIPTGFVFVVSWFNLYSILFNPRYMNDAALFGFIILPLIFFAIIPALSMLRPRDEQKRETRVLLIGAICVNLLALTLPALSGIIYALDLSN